MKKTSVFILEELRSEGKWWVTDTKRYRQRWWGWIVAHFSLKLWAFQTVLNKEGKEKADRSSRRKHQETETSTQTSAAVREKKLFSPNVRAGLVLIHYTWGGFYAKLLTTKLSPGLGAVFFSCLITETFLPPAPALLFQFHWFALQNCPHLSCEVGKSTPQVSKRGYVSTWKGRKTKDGSVLLWIRSEHVFPDKKCSFIYFQFAMLYIYRYTVLLWLKAILCYFRLLNSISNTERWADDQIMHSGRKGIGMMCHWGAGSVAQRLPSAQSREKTGSRLAAGHEMHN